MKTIGLDFGTTNSSASVNMGGKIKLLDIDPFNDDKTIMKSMLYFDESSKKIFAGEEAITKYTKEYSQQGRLLRSVKSLLPSEVFTSTRISGRDFNAPAIVAEFLKILRDRCNIILDCEIDGVAFGRPVFFSRDQKIDKMAEERLLDAAKKAGFKKIEFQLEPVAAALSMEQLLPDDKEHTVLLGDFGGGTSDFTLMKLCKKNNATKDRKNDILGLNGVYIAGDEFDSRIMWEKVAKWFGRGTTYKDFMGLTFDFPTHILNKIKYWHLLPMLREKNILRMIKELQKTSSSPKTIDNLIELIDDNLAIMLFRQIERSKCVLSDEEKTIIYFDNLTKNISEPLTKCEFEDIIGLEAKEIGACVDELLKTSNVSAEKVDFVFLTGGTSSVKIINQLFVNRFSPTKIKRGQDFSSIARGLGIMSARIA